MKKVYISPITECLEVYERYGVLEDENSGVAHDPMGKENNFTFDTDDPYELWGDDSSDEDWMVNNN